MRLSDFDFDLPEALIATRPARPRSSARMLVVRPDALEDRHAFDLPGLLRPGDRLVFNDTKVIPARLSGTRRRESAQGQVEARIEVTLLEPATEGRWWALVKPLRKLAPGEMVRFGPGLEARLVDVTEGQALLAFAAQGDFDAALDAAGRMPLPPYIAARRPADDQDDADYQPIFAKRRGAVAAPTASLHFDEALLAALARAGIETTTVTLHVGAGTFLPVKTDDVRDHRMHAEWGEVTARAAADIAATRSAGGRVIPVGTTALRLLEASGGAPFEGKTDIFITPGHAFRVADGLMTNFHLPKSTLMMLVSALMGRERMMEAYAHAIAARYRFFSYGDASLLLPG
ncbi:MAG: tRNA preQ1(34) S-adenosylmethionine ribosyltransferase-isomerase QueA [Hasllibacter sp.]